MLLDARVRNTKNKKGQKAEDLVSLPGLMETGNFQLEKTVFEHKGLIVGGDEPDDLLRIGVRSDDWNVVRFLLERGAVTAQTVCGDKCSLLHLLVDRESHQEDLENIKQKGTRAQKAAYKGNVTVLNTLMKYEEQQDVDVNKILMTRAALGGFLAGKSATITLTDPSIKFLVSKAIYF